MAKKIQANAADAVTEVNSEFAPAFAPRVYPQVIKYMGSKAKILDFLGVELGKVCTSETQLVDLFAGACALSGGFGHKTKLLSNDIQEYSAVIASVYLHRAEKIGAFDIVSAATPIAKASLDSLPKNLLYPQSLSLTGFNKIEASSQKLLQREFSTTHHLFTRAYSGTWWSAEQCVWIDAIREVLDQLRSECKIDESDFRFGLTCLMHAMAYTSQGTGHYAQYRDAKTDESMHDILKYRRASISTLFSRKFQTLLDWNLKNVVDNGHQTTALDYRECLSTVSNAVVYADPPYAFVHYSRFYHALETVVKYDYPEIQAVRGEVVKGRYRVSRHQSPFCIATQVEGAFLELFDGVKAMNSQLVLSYSNTGMIDLEHLLSCAQRVFGSKYELWTDQIDYKHMTMGRRADRSRDVKEALIVACLKRV